MSAFQLSTNNDSGVFHPVRPRRRRNSQFTLRLTSMIDMFTILLVFLLKSFSAEGQIMTVTPDLRLPESSSDKPPSVTSIVVVTQEWLLMDGRPLAKVADVLADKNIIIPQLLSELQSLRTFSETLGQLSSEMSFQGNISVQGDRDIPFVLLKKIMYTCGRVGYNNMSLAVTQKE